MAETFNGTTSSGNGWWFPTGKSDSDGWRFDVITLLAVIGESSVAEHSQAITSSILCMLPRIIPAPQALLRATRPLRMPEVKAKIAGVYSGVVLDSVGFFANIIHPLDDLRPFAFQVLEIKHKDLNVAAGGVSASGTPTDASKGFFKKSHPGLSRTSRLPRAPAADESGTEKVAPGALSNGRDTRVSTMATGRSAAFEPDPERGMGLHRQLTLKEKMTDLLANPTLVNTNKRPAVPPNFWSPVHVLGVLSTLLTVVLIIMAGLWHDGTAMVAIATISLASSVVGYASWWRPLLMVRSHTNKVPKGDVMIRTREGAFILVRCTEDVARELYAGTEECSYYVSDRYYRAFMGIGTVLLMVAVVLLGNCDWDSQVFIGSSYILLNGLYWGMGLLPRKMFWDLSRYTCEDVTPEDARRADEDTQPEDIHRGVRSYTRTLWYAIRETKRIGWVSRSGAAASTTQWEDWLEEATKAARRGDRNWNAVARKDEIMRKWESPRKKRPRQTADSMGRSLDDDEEDDDADDGVDDAVQHAPMVEVQLPSSAQSPPKTW